MNVGKYQKIEGNSAFPKELFTIYLTNAVLFDKLNEIAVHDSLPVETLVNLAVKRFVEDVEFVRGLRNGKAEGV